MVIIFILKYIYIFSQENKKKLTDKKLFFKICMNYFLYLNNIEISKIKKNK